MTILELYRILAAGQEVRIIEDTYPVYQGKDGSIPEKYFDRLIKSVEAYYSTLYIYI